MAPVAPSFSDLLAQGQAEAQARRPALVFADGDVTLAQLHAAAAMADTVIRFAAQAFKATFLDGATGDDLTALVDDHLNLQRSAATAAQVTLTFTRPEAGTEPAGTIPAGTTVATAFDANGDEVQFTTDSNLVFAESALTGDVVATAVDDGSTGNVAAGTIVRILDVPSFDDSFTVTNAAAAAGGNAEESDGELRTRARNFYSTLRRGTLSALEYGAQQVAEVRVAVASEDLASGLVTVRVSDADGASTAQMISDVETELENWRCAGTSVQVVGGTLLEVDLTATLTVTAGFDVDAVSGTFVAAVETRMGKLKVGDTLYLDSIIGALIAVAPDDVLEVTFSAITATPGGAQPIQDLVPTSSQVIRPGTITVQGA